VVQRELVLDSGLRVTLDGRPPQGSRHEVVFGVLVESGEAVAVKLEGVVGALGREGCALEYLTARKGPVPQLKAAGMVTMSGRRIACLVVERKEGQAPVSRDGWRRMGRALGCLGEPVSGVTQLPALSLERFGAEHARRVRELGDRLESIAAEVPDWPSLASAAVPRPGPLVLTHGDPGPGNFLDDGREGWLIDWEDVHVAPRGLDLARAAFIAWLGSGSAGFVGHDHQARAQGVVTGYLQTVPDGWRPTVEETRWWLAVAGTQFIHHRWRRGGRPGPWEEAAAVLKRCLAHAHPTP
jgi:aminoglycoside phosphotransferase